MGSANIAAIFYQSARIVDKVVRVECKLDRFIEEARQYNKSLEKSLAQTNQQIQQMAGRLEERLDKIGSDVGMILYELQHRAQQRMTRAVLSLGQAFTDLLDGE